MKKKLVIISITILLLTIFLVGCNNKSVTSDEQGTNNNLNSNNDNMNPEENNHNEDVTNDDDQENEEQNDDDQENEEQNDDTEEDEENGRYDCELIGRWRIVGSGDLGQVYEYFSNNSMTLSNDNNQILWGTYDKQGNDVTMYLMGQVFPVKISYSDDCNTIVSTSEEGGLTTLVRI